MRILLLGFLLMSMTGIAGQPPTGRQMELRNLLKHDCGACHGLTLKGGLGPALLPENLNGKSDGYLLSTILEGHKGTAMPPWQQFLSQEDAIWLLGILRKPE